MSYFRSLLEAAMGDGDLPTNLEQYEEAAAAVGSGDGGEKGDDSGLFDEMDEDDEAERSQGDDWIALGLSRMRD